LGLQFSVSSEVENTKARRAERREMLLSISVGRKPGRRESSRGQRPFSHPKRKESANGTAGLAGSSR
jgi:uncharacterized protein YceH (UPF0502 family)